MTKQELYRQGIRDTKSNIRLLLPIIGAATGGLVSIRDFDKGEGYGCHLAIEKNFKEPLKLFNTSSILHGKNTFSDITKETVRKADFVIINVYDKQLNYQLVCTYVIDNNSKDLAEFIEPNQFKLAGLKDRFFINVERPRIPIIGYQNNWSSIIPRAIQKLS